MTVEIFVEAGSLENLGGWVIDQQSMPQIGSSYVMAHGLGVPVRDATGRVTVPVAAKWHFWVRTRDWTAVWKRGTPAGRWQLGVGGRLFATVLGTNGEKWAWQKAGEIELPAGETTLALHDLTGFNGRCDAIYATTDASFVPPDGSAEIEEMRVRLSTGPVTDDPREYDLIVAGGGVAGACTALAALRKGLTVALIQDRGVIGGCNSSEIRVPMGGFAQCEPFPELGHTVTDIEPVMGCPGHHPAEWFEDDRKRLVFLREDQSRFSLVMNAHVRAAETDGTDADGRPRLSAVIARDTITGKDTRYRGKLFADCTGDAVLSRFLGAQVMYGREGRDEYGESLAPEKADRLVMGHSIQWGSRDAGHPVAFPDIDWGYAFTDETVYRIFEGDWEQECGQYRDQVDEIEYIRDFGLMTVFANWSFLKNHASDRDAWANREFTWVSPIGGKRESYRVVGDYVMSQRDIEERLPHPDMTAPMTWNIDLHVPDPDNIAHFEEPFRSCAYHRTIGSACPVPYRCLCSRDIANLFLGGRQISATHVAFACIRVMRTLGVLGEVVGLAAALCIQHGVTPREIGALHFAELVGLMKAGVAKWRYHAWMPCPEQRCSYHFKELGHIPITEDQKIDEAHATPELLERVAKIGSPHQQPFGKPGNT